MRRFAKIQEPLVKRREQLEKVKFIHQFVRDVEDEKLWIEEKMPLATSSNVGNSLLSVQLLEKKNQVGSTVPLADCKTHDTLGVGIEAWKLIGILMDSLTGKEFIMIDC